MVCLTPNTRPASSGSSAAAWICQVSTTRFAHARADQDVSLRAEADAAKGIVREPETVDPDEEEFHMGTPDDEISATIDIGAVNGAKFDALEAHISQIGDSFWMKMGRERFIETMRTEWFVRVTNPKNVEGNVDDIFAGYR